MCMCVCVGVRVGVCVCGHVLKYENYSESSNKTSLININDIELETTRGTKELDGKSRTEMTG